MVTLVCVCDDAAVGVAYARNRYPRTRTCCNRIAFQQPHDNDVRLSLDLNLVFVREKVTDDQWYTEDEHVREEDVCEFPMAVRAEAK